METSFNCQICSYPLEPTAGETSICKRCGSRDSRARPKSAALAAAFSLTALIFYIPANVLPFMTLEMYGNRTSTNIWQGIVSLMEEGSIAIAIVVFLASILIPFLKLLILFYLSASAGKPIRQKFKTKLFHFVEAIGRWSMLDIFLLAVLVSILKLGRWTNVQPEAGAGLFALVVIFTMLASAYFDPKIIWESKNEKSA